MNEEEYEQAMDIVFAEATADDGMVERGWPVADRVERKEDDDQADLLRQRLIGALEIAHDRFQRREAMAWLVMSYDAEMFEEFGNEAIVGCYGPFSSPEEALVQVGKHDNSSLEGFKNVIVPLYPPVVWKDER